MSIDAETLAEWREDAEIGEALDPRRGITSDDARICALIEEIYRLQTAATSMALNAGFQIGDVVAERDEARAEIERSAAAMGSWVNAVYASRDNARTQRDALRAQVDAVKWIYLPHRASLPGGFEDKCVCLGCKMARALGETGDESHA